MQHFHTTYSSSDRVTATSSETAFSRTVSLEALTIGKGDFYIGSVAVEAVGTNSTDTLTVKVYLGPASDPTTGILLASNTAVDVADGDNVGLFFTAGYELNANAQLTVGYGSTLADNDPSDLRMNQFRVTLTYFWHPLIEGMKRLGGN